MIERAPHISIMNRIYFMNHSIYLYLFVKQTINNLRQIAYPSDVSKPEKMLQCLQERY